MPWVLLAPLIFLFLAYQSGRLLLPARKITLGWWGQAGVVALLLLAVLGWVKAITGFFPSAPLFHLGSWFALGLAAYYIRFRLQFPLPFRIPWAHPLWGGTLLLALLPFVLLVRGWPSGDILQSIFWAEQIKQAAALPDYSLALAYNRDPSDFRTPLLHTLTAEIIAATGESIRSSAFFAWLWAIILMLLAAAWGEKIGGEKAAIWSFFFSLSLPAFLRYIVIPGYHYQNLVGELLLWAGLLWLLSLKQGDFSLKLLVLTGATFVALPYVHQLSALIAALLFLPLLATFLFPRLTYLLKNPRKLVLGISGAVLAGWALLQTSLGQSFLAKIPVLFTSQPHLASQVPSAQGFFQTINLPLFWLALAGFVIATNSPLRRRNKNFVALFFLLPALLAFAPRFGIDLPPVRCLLYSALPLAALAGGGAQALFPRLHRLSFAFRNVGVVLLLFPLLLAYPASWRRADLKHPTNATLTPALWSAVSWLRERAKAETSLLKRLLIDDPASRRLSWLLLSFHPAPARLGVGVGRRAVEESQTPLRRQIYLRLLAYEKIFALGANPASAVLWQQEKIGFLATTPQSSAAKKFHRNPHLEAVFENEEVVIFAPRTKTSIPSFPLPLTQPALLINQLHTPAELYRQQPVSLRATRLVPSPFPALATSSAYAQLNFNVRDYMLPLWPITGKDKVLMLGKPVNVLVRLYGNGAKWRYADQSFQVPADGRLHTFRLLVPAGTPLSPEGQLELMIRRLSSAPLIFELAAAWPEEKEE